MDMPEQACIACGAGLIGPFQPKIKLTHPEPQEEPLAVAAYAWICPGCGLVHWYAGEGDVERLREERPESESLGATPGEGYERRTQMQRMLRRVRRI
jgi:hypothetical protein